LPDKPAVSSARGRSWLERIFRPEEPIPETPAADAFELIGAYYDQLMQGVPYTDWVDYVEKLLDRFDARPQVALDLACGTGRVGAEMARRGYRAFGVDLSEGMARIAVEQGRLRAAVQDARALGLRGETFDLVVSLYDSLNYVLEPEGLLNCFRGVSHCLRGEGIFIFDLNTIRALALDLFTQNNLRSREPLLYSWRSRWDADARVCTVDMWFKWRGGGPEREFAEVHRQRGYADDEVRRLLQAADLKLYAVYNAYTFDPPNALSTRVFYIAHT
jgi:SAM-dependent methyltransferase